MRRLHVQSGQTSADLASQLREFSTAVGKVQSDYVTLVEALNNAPLERGEHIVSKIRAALSYLLEDGTIRPASELEAIIQAAAERGKR